MSLNFPADPSNGDTYDNFVYDGTKGAWKLQTLAGNDLTDLNDVTVTTPADGQALVYDTATSKWINESVAAEISGISDLPDVTITGTPADNEVLAYDTSSGDWINQTASEAGIATTSSLDSKVDTVNGTVTTASTSSGVVRNIYTSTSAPSGGLDGDIWIVYS